MMFESMQESITAAVQATNELLPLVEFGGLHYPLRIVGARFKRSRTSLKWTWHDHLTSAACPAPADGEISVLAPQSEFGEAALRFVSATHTRIKIRDRAGKNGHVPRKEKRGRKTN